MLSSPQQKVKVGFMLIGASIVMLFFVLYAIFRSGQ